MENVIYLDVLIILNIYVNYFLFLGTAKLMSLKLHKLRLFLGSMIGGIYSLIILFDFNTIELIIIKILMGISLVFIVFATKNIVHILKCGLYFFLVNFIYGGFMLAIWMFFAPKNMAYKNGVVYFDISALALIISTIVAYISITVVCSILNKRSAPTQTVNVTITLNGRQTIVNAFADTGNKLCDIFTGLPVIVVEYDSICDVFPDKIRDYFKNPTEFSFEGVNNSLYTSKLKLIPVCVVGKEFALPAFKPDSLLVNTTPKTAIVAVTTTSLSNGSFNAIINTALL